MASFESTTLTTGRLLLRALAPADAPAMFAVFSDPEVVRYWSSTPWTEMDKAHQFVASAEQDWLSGAGLRFGIEVAATGVDYLAVGALTHSARAMDLSLEIVER